MTTAPQRRIWTEKKAVAKDGESAFQTGEYRAEARGKAREEK